MTTGSPRVEKAIAAGRRLGKRLAKGVAVDVNGREELRPGDGLSVTYCYTDEVA